MAQYDVYANPSASAKTGVPFVVVLQGDLLDGLATRLTVPLATAEFSGKVPRALCPTVVVKGQALHALAHFAAPLPTKMLRKPVANLSARASELLAAVDAVLSGL